MLLWLMNMDFAAGASATPPVVTSGIHVEPPKPQGGAFHWNKAQQQIRKQILSDDDMLLLAIAEGAMEFLN